MLEKTQAIVLKSLKFKESSLIVTCFTAEFGLQSYILRGVLKSKKGGLRPAYFQILNQLNLVVHLSKKSQLHTIKELKVTYHYQSIPKSVLKQSMLMFMAEFLSESIREESPNLNLFEFLAQGLRLFDEIELVADFHLVFLLKLSKFLGFYPQESQVEKPYFDLLEGKFTSNYMGRNQLDMQETKLFTLLMKLSFDDLNRLHFNGEQRNRLLNIIINYYSLHLNGFRTPKSLTVLESLYR